MIEQRLKNTMAEVFDVPVQEINEDASPHTIPSWDSLKHVNLVLALQREFGIRFDNDEIPTMISYRMVLNTIKVYLEE